MKQVDPITLEIIQSSLRATGDEMFAAMRKTAMSAIIYEVLDMGTGITDAEGNLAASGAGIPAFVGVLDKAVQRMIELWPADQIHDGDVFVTNDPHYGGVTHLNDVVLLMPVFHDGRLVAWTANIAHWNDIGGKVPGSMSTDSTEVFQEGLRLPGVKLIDRGAPNRAVMEIMKVNSRLPDFLEGDMWAGIAAVRIGARRIEELINKYGFDVFDTALRHYMDYGEQVALHALQGLPKGTFTLSEEQETGHTYHVAITIGDDEFVVDLRDNPDQDAGPNNACRDGAFIAAQMVFKSLTGTDEVTNGGTFRPLKLLTRKGSVFDAQEPAAFAIYYEVEVRLYDLIWRCLAPHMDGRLPAGHFSSICGTILGGKHPDTGRHYTIVEPQVGGWGAYDGHDGNHAIFSGFHGETFNCPAEIAEARYGVYVDQVRLNDAPGGEGQYRGGRGIVVDYHVRSDGCFFTASYSRSRTHPWPLEGGREGSGNYFEILRAGGEVERHSVVTALRVDAGDVIRIHTANGAGYGSPKKRDPKLVEADLRNGLLDLDHAREVYGYEPS